MENSKRIIVFAPHPDDETWGCGGIIAKRINQGYDVTIVVLTDGRHAFSKMLNITSDPTPEELKEIRREEVKRSTRILGVKEDSLLFLDFEDGTLKEHETELEEKVTELLRGSPPPEEVYFTYEKDYHTDHRLTSYIVRNSIKKLNLNVKEYQYSIVHKSGRVGELSDKILNLIKRNMVRIDVSDVLSLKVAAVQEFRSETSIISSKQIKPLTENIEKYMKKHETFYLCN